MDFRYTISACVLFGLLLIVVIGCEKSVDVSDPGQTAPVGSTPVSKTDDRDTHYEQLLDKRLELQAKIFKAMELYRTTSQKVHEQRMQLEQLLGNKPTPETIDLFKTPFKTSLT